ncbi:hypothetical protein LTR70_002095 [Exophiala xenobiotica]|uniref:Uncharacterized protein n=1 Tax=Lithohypha guttulata TaxID=1690604 RepID=A0ABR0KBT7_9EURO|nr:hypothetical protein LTR24_004580 [Lithohypha guttulata]KAK5326328.1 hypothetical protein LTR70_002095 [Exophiala xenobiotica]
MRFPSRLRQIPMSSSLRYALAQPDLRSLSMVSRRSHVPMRSAIKAAMSSMFSPSASSPRQERLYVNTTPGNPTEVHRIGWSPAPLSVAVVINDAVTLGNMRGWRRKYAERKRPAESSRQATAPPFAFRSGFQTPPRYQGAQPGQKRKVDVFDAYGLGNRKDLSPTQHRPFRSSLESAKQEYMKAYMEEVNAGKSWREQSNGTGKKRQTAKQDVSDRMDGVEHTGLPALECPCRHCMDWRATTWEDTYLPPQPQQGSQPNVAIAQLSSASTPTVAAGHSARGVKRSAEDPDLTMPADQGKKPKLASPKKALQMQTSTPSRRNAGYRSGSSRVSAGAFQGVGGSRWAPQGSASSAAAATPRPSTPQVAAMTSTSAFGSSTGKQAESSPPSIAASSAMQNVQMSVEVEPLIVPAQSVPTQSAPAQSAPAQSARTPPRSAAPSPEMRNVQVPIMNEPPSVAIQSPPLTPPQALEELAMAFQTKASIASDSIGPSATCSPKTTFGVAQPELQTHQATPSAGDDGQAVSSTQVGAGGHFDVEDDTLEMLAARVSATQLSDVGDVTPEVILGSQPATGSSSPQAGSADLPDVVSAVAEEPSAAEPATTKAKQSTFWPLKKSRFFAQQLLSNSEIFDRCPTEIQDLISHNVQQVHEQRVNYDDPNERPVQELPVSSIEAGVEAGGLWNIDYPLQSLLDDRGDRTTQTAFLTMLESLVEQRGEQFVLPFARALLHRGVKPLDLIDNARWHVIDDLFGGKKWMIDNKKLDEAHWSSSREGIQAVDGLSQNERSLVNEVVTQFQRIGRISDVQKVLYAFFNAAILWSEEGFAAAIFQKEILRKSGYCPEDENIEFQNLWNGYTDCITEFFEREYADGSSDFPDQASKERADDLIRAFEGIFHYRYPRSFRNGNSVEACYPIDLSDPEDDVPDYEDRDAWENVEEDEDVDDGDDEDDDKDDDEDVVDHQRQKRSLQRIADQRAHTASSRQTVSSAMAPSTGISGARTAPAIPGLNMSGPEGADLSDILSRTKI